MKIATWNVNSIKVRAPQVIAWLNEAKPDIVCMQEIKCLDENFPTATFEELGYNVLVHGQKTYNGVAILSKLPIEDERVGLPGDTGDEQARYAEAVVIDGQTPIRIATIYLPNGNPAPGDKYDYKLKWMDRLKKHAAKLLADETPVVLAGDYNVIPHADDVHDPKAWVNDALFLEETRLKFQGLKNLGYTEAFRASHTDAHLYTFWDYQAGAWQKNNGIRIDHLLLSPQAADRLEACDIDAHVRAWEKPSDHVPVWVELSAAA